MARWLLLKHYRAGPAPSRRGEPGHTPGRGRWLARDPYPEELLSSLFFDREFIDGAFRLGQNDGRRCGGGLPEGQRRRA